MCFLLSLKYPCLECFTSPAFLSGDETGVGGLKAEAGNCRAGPPSSQCWGKTLTPCKGAEVETQGQEKGFHHVAPDREKKEQQFPLCRQEWQMPSWSLVGGSGMGHNAPGRESLPFLLSNEAGWKPKRQAAHNAKALTGRAILLLPEGQVSAWRNIPAPGMKPISVPLLDSIYGAISFLHSKYQASKTTPKGVK